MNSIRKVIYIGGGRDVCETLSKAKEMEIEIHYFQKEKSFDPRVKEFVKEVYLFDFDDIPQLYNTGTNVYNRLGGAAIFSLNESALLATALLRDHLNESGNSVRTVELLKDKFEMRKYLNSQNMSYVKSAMGRSMTDILNFLKKVAAPIIVKPKNESGSFSVFKISAEEEVQSVYAHLLKNKVEEFLIEEFLEGPEYSVESFTHNGKNHVLAVTEKFLFPNFVERGHAIPARISKDCENEIRVFVDKFLKTVGLKSGPTHTEVKLTSNGPKIIESHDRTGGDRINELVRLSTGVDMKKFAFMQIVGMELPDLNSYQCVQASAIEFIAPAPGKLVSLTGVGAAGTSKGVCEVKIYPKIGDSIHQLSDSLDRSGYVIAAAQNTDLALEFARQAAQKIEFRVS